MPTNLTKRELQLLSKVFQSLSTPLDVNFDILASITDHKTGASAAKAWYNLRQKIEAMNSASAAAVATATTSGSETEVPSVSVKRDKGKARAKKQKGGDRVRDTVAGKEEDEDADTEEF